MTAPPAAVLPPEPPNAILAGLACRCPRCGKGRLFSGILKIAERCNACGLDLRKQDAGDGPAVLVIFRSEEHTSELQSLMRISYAVFCLKKKNNKQNR